MLFVVISIVLSIIIPHIVQSILISEFRTTANGISTVSATSVALAVEEETNKLNKIVDASIEHIPNLLQTHTYDKNNLEIYSWTNKDASYAEQFFSPRLDIDIYSDDALQILIVNKKLYYNNNEIGHIVFVYGASATYKEVKNVRIKIILICTISTIVAFFIILLISRLISQPLSVMLNVVNKISKGQLKERVPIISNEEFGQLAATFNRMLDSLEYSYAELAITNRNIEAKIQERTLELQNQIDNYNKAEEKLKDINTMVSTIISTSPLPIITLTKNLYVKLSSPAVKNIFGYEDYELLGKVLAIIDADLLETFSQELERVTNINDNEKINIKGRKKNGIVVDLSIAVAANFDKQGNVDGYTIVVDDITERLIAEKALQESEAKYKSLIEDSTIGIAIIKDTNFTFVNKSLISIFGFTQASSLLKTKLTDVIITEDVSKLLNYLYENKQSKNLSSAIEVRCLCGDGSEKYIELSAVPIVLDGDVYQQCTIIDITDRKAAEQAMAKMNEDLENRVIDRTAQLNKTWIKLQQETGQKIQISKELQFKSEILERTTSICIVWNEFAECVYLSPWSLVVLGWKAEELLGNKFWEIVNNDKIKNDEFITQQDIIDMINRAHVPYDYQTIKIQTSTGRIKYLKVRHSLGQQRTLITAGTEITEQIQQQEELKVLSDKLFLSLQGEKELNELKTKFVSMVSHEFRTPLTVIMSSVGIIEQALEIDKPEIANKYIDKITKSVKTMTDLMEDVLIVDKSQSYKLEKLEKIDFVEFVKNTLNDIQEAYTFDSQVVLLEVKNDITNFYSDESALKHIVSNLVTNALKYTTNGKDTHITIEEKDDNIIFTVADQGIGIPEDDVKRLFSNFFRASNVGKIAGTGLGLHIAKQSVDNLFGDIKVSSVVGEGTTFVVTLPKDARTKLAESIKETKQN